MDHTMSPKRKMKHFKQDASVSNNQVKLWSDEQTQEKQLTPECISADSLNDVSNNDKETTNSTMSYPFKTYQRKKTRDDDQSNGLNRVIIPFKKTSSFWTTLESMEAFKKIPQNPHFYPLHECPLGLREGTAIGLMITFSTLVNELSNVRKDDLNNFLKSYRSVIDDLDKHGFDVKRVRIRFDELEKINEKKERYGEELMRIETRMIEIVWEKIKLQLEIDCVAQKRKELVAKLNEIARMRCQDDLKEASLRSSAKVVNAELKMIRGDIKW